MFGAVSFHSSLTQEDSRKLELQQKQSLAHILCLEYKSYSHALELTTLPRIVDLRSEACLKWAIKAKANPQHTDIFPRNPNLVETRQDKEFKEYFCRSAKFYTSSVPAMVRALNKANHQPAGKSVLPYFSSVPHYSSERWFTFNLPGRDLWLWIYHCIFT